MGRVSFQVQILDCVQEIRWWHLPRVGRINVWRMPIRVQLTNLQRELKAGLHSSVSSPRNFVFFFSTNRPRVAHIASSAL